MGRILRVTFALVREAGWSIVISERNAWVSSTLLHSVFFCFDLFQPTLFRWMCFFEHSLELEPGMIDSLLCILLQCAVLPAGLVEVTDWSLLLQIKRNLQLWSLHGGTVIRLFPYGVLVQVNDTDIRYKSSFITQSASQSVCMIT